MDLYGEMGFIKWGGVFSQKWEDFLSADADKLPGKKEIPRKLFEGRRKKYCFDFFQFLQKWL